MRSMLLAVAAVLLTIALAGYAVVDGKDEAKAEGNRKPGPWLRPERQSCHP